MDEDFQWRNLRARQAATASLIDHALEYRARPPLDLAGGVLDTATALTERWEAILTRIGTAPGDQLPNSVLDTMRTAVQQLRDVRATLAELVPAFDPDGRGRH